jgi:hypothetical protein
MSDRVLEIVTFSIVPGTDEDSFLRAAKEASDALHELDGFVARRLSRGEEGQWMDIVEWSDAQSAESAADKFPTIPGAHAFCSMIDMRSVKMAHQRVVAAA